MLGKYKHRCNLSYRQNTKNSKKRVDKKTHSKSMWILSWVQILATLTAFFSFWQTVETKDPSVLMVLIPAVFVDASAVTALVLWKRKNERIFSFFSDEKTREAMKWFKENDIDPVDFFRAFKE